MVALSLVVANPVWIVESDERSAHFGNAVSSAGDVNGDGYADVIVGAYWFDDNPYVALEGKVYQYFGSASGLDPIAAWTVESNTETALLGQSVSSAGDVNGDGYGDVVVGAPGYAYSGS